MSRYIIEADELKHITAELEYSALVCNRTHITKIFFRGAFVAAAFGEDGTQYQMDCPFGVEINGEIYSKFVPYWESSCTWFDTDILLEKGDTLSIKILTVSASDKGGYTTIDIYFHNGHAPGWDCESGFFAIEYEGTREEMWRADSNNYPTLKGVTAELEFYNNYNLPHPHKYKVTADINDGYPYIHRIKSGWCAAYPYKKDGVWSSTQVFVRTGGIWHECSATVYDAMSALYRQPKIKTAWEITFGKNGGYPYIAYGEMPFYENS